MYAFKGRWGQSQGTNKATGPNGNIPEVNDGGLEDSINTVINLGVLDSKYTDSSAPRGIWTNSWWLDGTK